MYAAGESKQATDIFADAERRQRENRPEYPFLYSVRGYRYCDLLLSQGRAREARNRAARTIGWAQQYHGLLDIALDNLTLGRAGLALALQSLVGGSSAETTCAAARAAAARLDEAVDRLHASGQVEHVPSGLLARAAFRRAAGEWDGAARDLDEAQEVAEPGPMRLHLCDCALERARLALARREAFAPLNGLVKPSPPPPTLPEPTAAARLREGARAQLSAARGLAAEWRYQQRNEELSELDEAVAARRRYADLPPRV